MMRNAAAFILYFVFILVSLVDFGRHVISSAEPITSTVVPKTNLSQKAQKDNSGSNNKTELVWILVGTAAIVLVLAVAGFLVYKYRKRKERRNKNEAERYVVQVLQQLENENQVVQFLHMLELSSRETLEKERVSSLNQGCGFPRSEVESRHTSQSTSIIDRMNVQIPPTYDELFTDNVSNFGPYNNGGFTGDDAANWTLYGRARSVSQSINDDQDSVFINCNSTARVDVTTKAKQADEKDSRKTEEIHTSQLQQEQHKQHEEPQQERQQKLCHLRNDIVHYDNGEDETGISRLSMDLNKMFSEENVIHWYSDETRAKYIRALSASSGEEEEVECFGEKENYANQIQT